MFFVATSFPSTMHLSNAVVVQQEATLQAPDTMGAYVRSYFAETPILADIAWCESRDRQWNKDGSVFRGEINHSDIGIMQINVAYHADEAEALGIDLYSLGGNLKYAQHLYNREGTDPWASSEACWGKLAAS